jgi:hypothetical protein
MRSELDEKAIENAARAAQPSAPGSKAEVTPSEELVRRFTRHQVGEEQREAMDTIRGIALHLGAVIEEVTPPGRERANAITDLELVVMWSAKAIATPTARAARELTMERPPG